jgi:glycosyltransferase involved in cell wall biosynthesis
MKATGQRLASGDTTTRASAGAVAPTDRILLVTHYYAPETGAPQRRWSALISRFVAQGVQVTVLAPPPHYPSGRRTDHSPAYAPGTVTTGRHGETVIRVRFREHTNALISRTCDQLVAAASSVILGSRHLRRRGRRPSIVIGTVPGIPSMFAAWALARRFRATLVIEMRDAWPDLIDPSGILQGGPRARVLLRRLATRSAHRAIIRLQTHADLVVTTTRAFGQVERLRGAHAAVIRNGTEYPIAAPAGAVDLRTTSGVRELRAVYVGTVGRSQGLETVVRAAAAVQRRGHAIRVRIIGAGGDIDHLRALADIIKAPVTVEGRMPASRVPALYEWADTSIVALRDWEPFRWTIPSKLPEVMASGNHMTALLAGEAAQLVASLGAGTVVPPGDTDALTDLWVNWIEAGEVPPVLPDAGAWVRQNADDDVLAKQYLELLARLAG